MPRSSRTDPSTNQGRVPRDFGAKSLAPHSDMPETTEDTRSPSAQTAAPQIVRAELEPGMAAGGPASGSRLGVRSQVPPDRNPIGRLDCHFVLQTCLQTSLAISRNEFHLPWVRFWKHLAFSFLGAADQDSGGPEGARPALSSSSPTGTKRRGTRSSP